MSTSFKDFCLSVQSCSIGSTPLEGWLGLTPSWQRLGGLTSFGLSHSIHVIEAAFRKIMPDDEIRFVSTEQQQQLAESVGVAATKRHIFLCCDQAKPKCCDRERSLVAWSYLKSRLKELGLSEQGGIFRTKANCLRICEGGPIAVVYPEGTWYGGCDPEVLEEIIQRHLIAGEVLEQHLIVQNRL